MRYVVLDFEYREVSGRLQVLCVAARCLESGQRWRKWLGDTKSPGPPFPLGPDTILVAHAVTPAEARCLLTLGWKFPGGWIDTYVEEKILARGAKLDGGFGLLACCRRRGIGVMSDYQKADMRELCLRDDAHDESERQHILDYCAADVEANAALFSEIKNEVNMPQVLLRGRYLAECSQIMDRGLPADVSRLRPLQKLGNEGLRMLFARHFDDYGILSHGSFNRRRFAELVDSLDICWPRTSAGAYATDKDTLKEMARTHGAPWGDIRQLLQVVRSFRVDALADRGDGRLISDLRPFGTITGRCAPSTSAFLWNGPKWLRSLLQPPPGRTILSIDWSNQEFAIAAALSEDPGMISAYDSGDPYLDFAKKARRVPEDAIRKDYEKERAQFKIVSLAVLMGMSKYGVARRLRTDLSRAQELLVLHRQTFGRFWGWSDAAAGTAGANLPLETAFGLVYQPGAEFKPRTARNFLLQATGSDMLRLAVLLLADRGVDVITTVHDSVISECDTRDVVEVQQTALECMREASLIALWGRLEVRTEVTRVDHPYHYQDSKGRDFWVRLADLLKLPLDNHGG